MSFKPSRPPQFSAPPKWHASAEDVRALADALLAAGERLRQLARTFDSADAVARGAARAGVQLSGTAAIQALKDFAQRVAGGQED